MGLHAYNLLWRLVINMPLYSHSSTCVVCSHTTHKKPSAQFVRTMGKITSSCWTPMIKNTLPNILLNSTEAEEPEPESEPKPESEHKKKPLRFWSRLRGLDSLNIASKCLRTLIRKISEKQPPRREIRGCFFAVMKFWWRGRICPASPRCASL